MIGVGINVAPEGDVSGAALSDASVRAVAASRRKYVTAGLVVFFLGTVPSHLYYSYASLGTYGGGLQKWADGSLQPPLQIGPLKPNSMIVGLAASRGGDPPVRFGGRGEVQSLVPTPI